MSAGNIRKLSLFVTCALVAGCFQPPPPPSPTQLHVAASPAEVVQIATRELTFAGFEVAVSDANAGTVVAKRTRTPEDQGADITCKYQHGSMAARMATSTLTTSISAKPASGGSDVVINGLVHLDFSTMPDMFRSPPNDKDCVSSGAVEKRIADALR